MRQTLHIFRKDARYLWREIVLVWALAAVFARIRPLWMDTVILAAAIYLLARLIHAEAIPGDRQFWITRPYRWQSLFGAKLLFMLAFVNLPLMLAQWWIAAAAGFPASAYLPGLLWSQVVMILAVSLPAVALASVTPGIVSFIFSILILAAVWYGIVTLSTLRDDMPSALQVWPGAIGWIRATYIVLALAATALSMLYGQYRRRMTLLSRAIGVGGLAILSAAQWVLPWAPAWALQERLSRQPVEASLLQVSADPSRVRFYPRQYRTWHNIDVRMPIAVTGVPAGIQLKTDALSVTYIGADGTISKSEAGNVLRGGGTLMEINMKIDHPFFERQHDKSITIRGTVYMTLFGHARQQTIPVRAEPVNALDGLQCYLDPFEQYYCRSAFQWPGKLVLARFGTEMSPLTGLVSYSPFPASLQLDPIEGHWAPAARSTGEVTIVVKEPLAHVRREFELRGVRVTDSSRTGPLR